MKNKLIILLSIMFILSCNACKKQKDYTYLLDEYLPSVIENDLTLPTSIDNLKLEWVSENQDIITNEGIISKAVLQQKVIITLNVYKDKLLGTYQKEVTISAEDDYSYIINQYIPNSTSTNIELPTTYESLRLEWISSNSKAFTNKGEVTKMINDTKVLVTLNVYYESSSWTYQKELIIEKETDFSYLIDKYVPDQVTSDLTLPTDIIEGATLTWSTSNENVISPVGKVTRMLSDQEVIVSLKIVSGTTVFEYNKTVTVLLQDDYNYLFDQFIPTLVIDNLVFPTTADNGASLIWSTSDEMIISNLGIVSRRLEDINITITLQVYTPDLYVTLTKVVTVVKDENYIDYAFLIDEYVPSTTNINITLPDRYGSDIMLIWSTSDELTLSKTGVINQGRTDLVVTVTLSVYDKMIVGTYKKDIVIEKIEFAVLRENKTIFGYYSTWYFNGYDNNIKNIDVVNLSFAYVLPNFTLDLNTIDNNIFRYLSVRKDGVRVVLSVQGYEAGGKNFSNAASTEQGREKLANAMLEVVEKYHFDGIDIDWEYPGFGTGRAQAVDTANYTLLMKKIYETLKEANEDYLVTAALPGGAYGYRRYDLGEVQKYLDFIHMMTYDLESSSLCLHHSALYSSTNTATMASADASIDTFNLKGVPLSKLVIGIAFYGKFTQPSSPANGGIHSTTLVSSYTSIAYKNIATNYLNRLGTDVTYYWDNVSKAPYLYDASRNIFISYENEESIKEKCRYAINEKLGGVMIWELGEDYQDTLLNAVFDGLKRVID